jgi:hypothetical protein
MLRHFSEDDNNQSDRLKKTSSSTYAIFFKTVRRGVYESKRNKITESS